jgi:hypothetical protein
MPGARSSRANAFCILLCLKLIKWCGFLSFLMVFSPVRKRHRIHLKADIFLPATEAH